MSTHLHPYYLQQMGIDLWKGRKGSFRLQILLQLESKASACVDCSCHKTRTKTVFARGNPNARLMIISDVLDAFEDKNSISFVEKSSILLSQMLFSIGLADSDIYLTPILKCFPGNHDASSSDMEIKHCAQYLNGQIEAVSPNVILALGSSSSQWISQSREPLSILRGRKYTYQGIPSFVSFHSNYLLENPQDKKKAYVDWLAVKKELA